MSAPGGRSGSGAAEGGRSEARAGREALERAGALLGPRVQRDRPLGPLTTYRVGGPAALFLEVGGEADLLAAHRAVAETAVPVLVVGRGSNLLVADAGFPGLALALGPAYDGVTVHGTAARAGGATYLPVLARRTAAGGMAGLEWAVGVPGSVGGGVRMNAGGHGSDIRAALVRAAVFDVADGTTRQVGPSDLALAYRESSVSFTQVVLWAELAGEAGDPSASRARIDEIVRWRRQHQPGGANAGSVFTNPEGDAAGRLVEAAGQRGRRLGSAQVSEKHANFIQADPGGSADDVVALIALLQERVADHSGVWLEPELRLVGFPSIQPHVKDEVLP